MLNPERISRLISEDLNSSVEATSGLLTYWDNPKVKGAVFIIGEEKREIMQKIIDLAFDGRVSGIDVDYDDVMDDVSALIDNGSPMWVGIDDASIDNILLTRGPPKEKYRWCDLLGEMGIILAASDDLLDLGDMAIEYGVWLDDDSTDGTPRIYLTDNELIERHMANTQPDYDIMTLSKHGLRVM